MDQDSLRAISTLLIFLAFVGLTISVYRKRNSYYDDAANLPFVEDGEDDLKKTPNGDKND
ncbi:cbb3-type cytochrome oxidase subunit 3 [Zhongshania arctica]|uniref:Cbb3-type cytochrome oxidase subunit 3 n=1 Tax=Zhongshania arctica TaxID=3238302 RepID=A0ABV3TWA3_9GAMM|tara:strand:- start:351 stop:530 length:180 start_codon:yes stop_codon:yes gene_type:complete